jgi:hypothetical protein
MGMSLDIGSKVKVRKVGGGLIRGVIKSISFLNGKESEYGVSLENGNLHYYYAKDLIKDTDNELTWECTCGAKTTYDPLTPPGHASYCDLEKLRRIWK